MKFKILIFLFSFSLFALSPEKVVDLMEKDSSNKILRPWFPTTLPDYKLSASNFSRWAVFGTPELSDLTSTSCFEIILLYAIKSGTVDREWVKNQFKFVEGSIAGKKRDRVPVWIKSWLSVLAKDPAKRINYVRAPHPPGLKKIDWGVELDISNTVGERIFPKRGDIIFFNPINSKKNSHFDHVTISTGRRITRRMLTGNPSDDKINLEAEILSFYGRGSNRDTLIERDTIEHMLDENSMIKREPPEGPDRQVFFSPPPWI
jgi:hypothetical protein